MARLAAGLLALLFGGTPLSAVDPVPAASQAEPAVFTGKVLPTAKALEKLGVKVDADSPGVAFVTEKGVIHPIVKDAKSRMLFLEKSLQDRSLQITARRVAGTEFLQVTAVQSIKDGKLHDVYYWCENCQLRSYEPGACKCCGGDTVLTETPAKAK